MAKKNDNLKKMSAEDLKTERIRLEDEVKKIRFTAEGSRNKNVKQLSVLRKDIARVLTEMNKSNKNK